MSIPFRPDALDRFRADARVLLGRAAAHEHVLEALVHTAESEMRWAQSRLSGVSGVSGGTEWAPQLPNLLRWQLQRSVSAVAVAKRLCAAAREQRQAAAQFVAQLDGDESAGEQRTPWRSDNVLVVDDNGDVRRLVAVVLENAGFVVRTAVNGLEALLAAHEMQPAVIVMDLTMPVLDGIEATRLIKSNSATRAARVIAFTGKPDLDQDLAQGLFVAVLQKPAEPDVVLSAVHQAVGA